MKKIIQKVKINRKTMERKKMEHLTRTNQLFPVRKRLKF
jgi:hypothetical protein